MLKLNTMKKILLIIGIFLLCIPGYSQKSVVISGNLSDLTAADSLIISTDGDEDWLGKNVKVSTYIRHTDDDDATIFYGGTDRRATAELKTLGWVTTEKDFFYVNASGTTINPLVVDTAGTILEAFLADTAFYQCKFDVESFSWPRPAVYLFKNSATVGEFIIIFTQIE